MKIDEVLKKIRDLYEQIEEVDVDAKDYIIKQLCELSGCSLHDAYIMGFKHGISYEAQVVKKVLADCEAKLKNEYKDN